jgi:hypothetical protein
MKILEAREVLNTRLLNCKSLIYKLESVPFQNTFENLNSAQKEKVVEAIVANNPSKVDRLIHDFKILNLDIDNLSVTQLRTIARAYSITGFSRFTKYELIDTIKEARETYKNVDLKILPIIQEISRRI